MSKEFQIRDGNLIASFDLENEDGDIDFCKLLKVSHGVADEIGMFVDYVATNKIIKDKSKQIADLEAKLTLAKMNESFEKEKKDNAWKFIEQLKQQLAEKDQTIENWQTMYQSVMQSCHNGIEEDKKLREHLADKEKEIERLKLLVDGFDKLKQYDKDADLVLINPKTCYIDGKELVIKSDNQDKISFAVEQLEKVKDHYRKFKNTSMGIIKRADIVLFIDNQIEELKKENDNA